VAVSSNAPKDRLAQEVEIALFRIAQEALTNVAKHARVKLVEIRFECAGTDCILSVSDDGVGFEPDLASGVQTRPGLGMATMRERTSNWRTV